jgi:hypothetical protein
VCVAVEGFDAYLKLAHNLLVEILRTGVDAKRHKITAVDMLLFDAPLSLLYSGDTLSLQPSSLSFLLSLTTLVRRLGMRVRSAGAPDAQKLAEVGAARSMVAGSRHGAITSSRLLRSGQGSVEGRAEGAAVPAINRPRFLCAGVSHFARR